MHSFGRQLVNASRRLTALVHPLDVGGGPVPEAAGLEALMAGACERLDDDDVLLAQIGTMLKLPNAHYVRAAARAK